MHERIQQPLFERMPAGLSQAARHVAECLERAGHVAWMVGGAVRDLALDIDPHDVDFATDARPAQIQELFSHTVGVGAAFGTVLVQDGGTEVQVTTFRSEDGYGDARRPDRVRFGSSLEEDASRRDFTCNALYLAPSSGEFRDPEGGLADLRAGRLVCVGDAGGRFREDGLRILRLGRFAATYGLSVDTQTLAAARSEVASLSGVSPERVFGEFQRIAVGPDPGCAFGLFARVGALEVLFPDRPTDVRVLTRLGPGASFASLLGALFGDPGLGFAGADERRDARRTFLDGLRLSRSVRRACLRLWELEEALRELELSATPPVRSVAIRLVRDPLFRDALALYRARGLAPSAGLDFLAGLLDGGPEAAADALHPAPLLRAEDLLAKGLRPGALFGEVLREAETKQLDGELTDREDALHWLAARAESARGKVPGELPPEGEREQEQ